jgi:hypothetical protein
MFWSAALLRRFFIVHESRENTRKFQRVIQTYHAGASRLPVGVNAKAGNPAVPVLGWELRLLFPV